ncbi:hypothetical protein BN946_scf184884.g45 [Trametes cinnabarina]|uniref:Uncharacterized protein n=1 Tax=Pycnoporus cinnabarinus TaxID=5643 RepID=A0A060S6R4_PYCCI|nr:hypothetical protein BN946_scf184884.g45 [Trametes cinnabarina]
MLFFSGTAEDLPPVYDTSAFHDHAVISVCEAAPTLAGDTLSLSAPSVHSLEIPEYSDYTIPYVSDILSPPTDLLDPCTPSESTDDSLCYRNLRVPENPVPPVATVAQVRAEGRMKRSYSPYPSSSSSGPSSRPCSRASYVSDVPISQRPRNVQVPFDIYHAVMQTHTGWECPFCDYVQTKQRTPDLKRHIATHCAEGASLHSPASSDAVVQIRCCGVPLRLASRYGISISDTFKALVIDGVAVVGGCGMTFSRRDALLRHVSNPNNDCVDWKALQKRAGESPVKCSKKARSRT